MRRKNLSLLGLFSVLFSVVGCGVLEPDGQQQVLRGILDPDIDILLVEGDARVGEPLAIWVHTTGWCQGEYVIWGPYDTRVSVEGMEVVIWPFDLVSPRRSSSTTCQAALAVFRHQVTVVPPAEGVLTIRALGRELPIGGHPQRADTPVAVEQRIPVNH